MVAVTRLAQLQEWYGVAARFSRLDSVEAAREGAREAIADERYLPREREVLAMYAFINV